MQTLNWLWDPRPLSQQSSWTILPHGRQHHLCLLHDWSSCIQASFNTWGLERWPGGNVPTLDPFHGQMDNLSAVWSVSHYRGLHDTVLCDMTLSGWCIWFKDGECSVVPVAFGTLNPADLSIMHASNSATHACSRARLQLIFILYNLCSKSIPPLVL